MENMNKSLAFRIAALAALASVGAVRTSSAAYRQLFFDDQRFFVRENLVRTYGRPQFAAAYQDPMLSTMYGWAWAVDGPDGAVHLIYMGEHKENHKNIVAAAVSQDGVHFTPRNTAAASGLTNPAVPNQILPNPPTGEPGTLIEDPFAPPSERYKLLFCDCTEVYKDWHVGDDVFASPDLVSWRKMENCCWNRYGTEPVVGAFYNDVFKCFTIMSRPDWGQRRVCVVETCDWHVFTEPELCLQVDSLDPPLAELYGMPAIAYEGYYIGFPLIYHDIEQKRCIKFHRGRMHCELAYSLNGRHWQRSLREPFFDGRDAEIAACIGGDCKMAFLSCVRKDKDGSLLLYGSATHNEHGSDNSDPRRCAIFVYRLRQDGFVGLKTLDGKTGRLASRALICQGGDLTINLKARQATCAIYPHLTLSEGEPTKPVAGFGHEDCTPFTGDSACWRPQWKGGSLAALKDKLILIELKLNDGTVYSFTVDGMPQMEIEAERYRSNGKGRFRAGF